MKALILAAGLGARLRPHTLHRPKPLFPISGRPLIDITICRLIDQGVSAIIINVHHLHRQITDYIKDRNYPVPIVTRYEKTILGTGGAIQNVRDFLGDQPFLVINSDIATDIDVSTVAGFHRHHQPAATLVMHDNPAFNKVWVDKNGNIVSFSGIRPEMPLDCRCLAFTGIQIIDPVIMDFFPAPENQPPCGQQISSIAIYEKMIAAGRQVKAFVAENHYWMDIGTPENYARTVFDQNVSHVFETAFHLTAPGGFTRTLLAGDGSDRKWYRITPATDPSGSACADNPGIISSIILGDHGIHAAPGPGEAAAFVNIGTHLFKKKISVPKIYYSDIFSGHVYMQDLGDLSLQAEIQNTRDTEALVRRYCQIIDQTICLSLYGKEGFDPAWAFQTPAYDRPLILEKECRYFVEAFLNTYLAMNVKYARLEPEFDRLADLALENAVFGLMHRDLQSRNIMIKDNKPVFIDFQGARTGPLQYDLAALLTDPYVNLAESVQARLLEYSIRQLEQGFPVEQVERKKFLAGYRYCTLTRNLQALGAFGFLCRVKTKPFFEAFIPVALKNLYTRLSALDASLFPVLTDTVKTALITYHATR